MVRCCWQWPGSIKEKANLNSGGGRDGSQCGNGCRHTHLPHSSPPNLEAQAGVGMTDTKPKPNHDDLISGGLGTLGHPASLMGTRGVQEVTSSNGVEPAGFPALLMVTQGRLPVDKTRSDRTKVRTSRHRESPFRGESGVSHGDAG